MNRKSQILLIIFIVLVIASIGVVFYRYLILKDFVIVTDEKIFKETLIQE